MAVSSTNARSARNMNESENRSSTPCEIGGLMVKLVFPTVLIVIDVAAAAVYVAGGDVRRFIYWMAAATLTATVTY